MRIAIISDSHDNIPNIKKFLTWANENKIEMIIHCGDITTAEIIKEEFATKFKGQIHLVFGNVADRDNLIEVCDEIDNITIHDDEGHLEIDKHKIAFCHYPEQAEELTRSGKYNLVFYGHTHKPWIERLGKTQIINPGTLAGLFQKASFATYSTKTKNLELKTLEHL